MRALLGVVLAIGVSLSLVATGAASAGTLTGGALDPGVEGQLDRYVEESARAWEVPAVAIGIVSGDELVYARGFGTTRSGTPVDERTLFEIGSSSKAFLGATQAIMVDRGAFAWDDRVVEHFPRFAMRDRWVTRNLTIADLLAQRSGLSPQSGSELFLLGYGKRHAIAALSRIPAVSSFRSEFAYQNLPHLVAGDIVARASGAGSWPEALDRLLLGPLGMAETAASKDALEGSENATRGHQRLGGTTRELGLVAFPSNSEGSGSIVSNVADLSRWLRLQLGDGAIDGTRLISEEQIAVTRRPRIAVDEAFAEVLRLGPDRTYPVTYATGWFVHSLAEGRIIEHGGNTVGYAAAIAFDPDRRVGVVALSNLGFGEGLARPVAAYALDLLQGRAPRDYAQETLDAARAADREVAAPARPVSPARLRGLAGRYRSAVYGALRLAPRGRDRLTVTIGPTRATGELVALGGDVFRLEIRAVPQSQASPVIVAPARVLRGRDGRVTGMDLGLNPTDVPFVRVDR